MKINRIEVDGIELLDLIEFQFNQEVGKHAELLLNGYIRDDLVDEYRNLAKKISSVKVIGYSEQNDRILILDGYIKDFQVISLPHIYCVKIFLVSHSYEMDLVKKIVPYQSGSLSLKNIADTTIGSYIGSKLEWSVDQEKKADEIIIQYQETDWEFIKRIASHLEAMVFAGTREKGPELMVGCPKDVVKYDVEEYDEISYSWIDENEGIQLTTRMYYEMDSELRYAGKTYYIYSTCLEYYNGRFVNRYLLKFKTAFDTKKYYNPGIVGASIEGNVMSISGDHVTVKMIGEEPGHLFAYATIYSSPDGTGWFCMPEIGDRIRVYFPSADEKDAYVISSVHESTDSGARTNPDEKSIKNKYGKELLFTPDSILITNNAGMYIEINDNTGITIMSDKAINISSEEEVGLISVNNSVNVVGAEQIALIQDESQLVLNKEITMEAERVLTV